MRIVVGDTHGCIEEFDELMKLVSFKKGTDTVYMLGDLVDRGPDSRGMIQRAKEYNAIVIKGNHEEKHVRYKKNKTSIEALPKYFRDIHHTFTDEEIEWMDKLPIMHRLTTAKGTPSETLLVHAGIEPGLGISKQTNNVLRLQYVDPKTGCAAKKQDMYTKPVGYEEWVNVAKRWNIKNSVLYGHIVYSYNSPEVTHTNDKSHVMIGLDTGCCFGGHLSGVIVETSELAQVRAKKEYAPAKRSLKLFGEKNDSK